jgi:SAM-dependent methyltransferase
MDFREYLRKKVLEPNQRILEFGPLIRPTVTKDTHPKIYYADIRSTEDIRKLYTSNDYLESTGLSVDLDSIVAIDYVVKDSYKKTFEGVDKFDVVILSHVIEHMPDIIEFFQDIKNVVKETGRLVIIYPDARYCFDHFRNGTSFIDAYDVYTNKPNSSKRVFDFTYNVVNENNSWKFWNDEKESISIPRNEFSKSLKAYQDALGGILPDDTHFWPFSNYQLIKFLYDMDRAGLLDFEVEKFYPTPENQQECMLILKPKAVRAINYKKYQKLLSSVSPSAENIKLRKTNDALVAENANLKKDTDHLIAEKEIINARIADILSSKKWRYSSKIAAIINKIMRHGSSN